MSTPRHDKSRYLTITEMANYLHVSRQSLYRAKEDGRLKCVLQVGNVRGRLVPMAEVERYEREEMLPA